LSALPNLFDAETRRLAAELYGPRAAQIQRASQNADWLDETFQARADAWVISYAASHGPFTASWCTNAARLAGVESPAHGCWGAVFKRAQANGVIERIGYRPRKNGNPAPLYASIKSRGG
jgi:hypothetical protein